MTTRKLFLPVFFLMLLFAGMVTGAALAQDGNSPPWLAAGSIRSMDHAASSEITVPGTIQQVQNQSELNGGVR